MGFRLNENSFNNYVVKLNEKFSIYAPVEIKGKFSDTKVVGYDLVTEGDEIIKNEKTYFSPKEVFYPIRETLFHFLEESINVPSIDTKPILIFLRPCDINGIKRLDSIFLSNGDEVDFYYLRRRNLVKFMMIECTQGFDNCFCVSMDSNISKDYDGAISFGREIKIDIKDDELFNDILDEEINFSPEYIEENTVKVNIPKVDSITKDMFDHDMWKEYTKRCISCGRCNTSCITCACFTMQDIKLSDDKAVGERRRVWASCHIDGYSDMAGGHSFRVKRGQRMRFKTMHKINDYHKRFGEHMCIGCGRCSDVCPEHISFSTCINKLNDIVDGGNNE